ncbi:S9 family peptidase [Winogradskyella litoriviva]|uniref:prolyl oligopeptidase n=1 Tax=Winogradskyella litoriviva TaxID=1220182 RepID=A0ABX2E7D0_9FLAO|nr:prolyl oligopeptidase family serine peptidase [Winogradskyella litoriviva]NRD24057.1 S9 family peptidase [Winogradskyella litoriviva]
MKFFLSCALIFLFSFYSFSQKTYKYPEVSKGSFVDTYFGESIEDPYQWMENPADPRLEEWLAEEQRLTNKQGNKYLHRWTLRSQLGSMYYDTRVSEKETYQKQADSLKTKYQYKYRRSSSKRSADLLYRLRGQKNYKSLINIKDFRKNKDDNVSIVDEYLNEDFDLIAVEISHNGSDWHEIYFFDLLTGKLFDEKLENFRATSNLIWKERDVIYDAYEKAIEGRELLDKAKGQKLFYHKLGTKQSEDTMIYENPDLTGTNLFSYFELNDKVFFRHFYNVRGKSYKALSVAYINPESIFLSKFLLYPDSKKIYVKVELLEGDNVILSTNWDSGNGRVLQADITQLNKVIELIPEYDSRLTNVNKLGKGKIACIYSDNGKNMVLIFDMEGKLLRTIDFPEGKEVKNFYENNDSATHTDFSLSSFFHPKIWYQLSLSDLTFKPAQVISVPYDAEKLETRYVKYKSKDGTEIPMYITCAKETVLDGNNPTLIYGYGGYGTTIVPSFNESLTLWLLHGGVYAVPNIRGGGANGSEWSLAGRRLNKQNTIDDFIAAAEYLVEEKYTNSNKLAISGGSHGALIVGAAITQRPELFKAAIAEAGPYDMLRMENFTVGSVNTNISEYGVTSNELDYKNLKSYSPLHNIKEGVKYPNLLLITGAADDRVPPLHSYKFLATLQEKASKESLFLMHVIEGSGHGGALNSKDFTEKLIHKYSFLFDQLDVDM